LSIICRIVTDDFQSLAGCLRQFARAGGQGAWKPNKSRLDELLSGAGLS
jgi:hypothetical protein